MDDFFESTSAEDLAWERGWFAAWRANELDASPDAMRLSYLHASEEERLESGSRYLGSFATGWRAWNESRSEVRHG